MKYFETVIKVSILSSDEPLGDGLDLRDIYYAISEGPCLGQLETISEKELTAKEVAQRACDYGSDSEFFFLDDEGNEIVEEGEN